MEFKNCAERSLDGYPSRKAGVREDTDGWGRLIPECCAALADGAIGGFADATGGWLYPYLD